MSFKFIQKHQSNETANSQSPQAASFQDNRSGNGSIVQRASEEEDEAVQKVAQRQENNTGLPDNLKSGMESLSGVSLDSVKVHYNSAKPATVQSHAYAQGTDIHVAPGQENHLPHELGHVVQQAQGRVQPTTTVAGMQVNDSPALENEATQMGEQALQMKENNETS